MEKISSHFVGVMNRWGTLVLIFIILIGVSLVLSQIRMPKSKFTVSSHLGAPHNRVWELISDIGNISIYHPGVEVSKYLTTQTFGVGTRAVWIFPQDKGQVVERVYEYKRDEKIGIEFVSGSLPVRLARTMFIVSKASENTTYIEIQMTYQINGGFFGWILAELIAKSRLQARMLLFLEGLEQYIQTGTKLVTHT